MNFSIMQWNAHSLVAHQMELKNFSSSTQARPSLVCVQETYLKSSKSIKFFGYQIERSDREGKNSGGGVATLIAEGISYAVMAVPAGIDALCITINLTSSRKIAITNIYHPPGKTINMKLYETIFAMKDN